MAEKKKVTTVVASALPKEARTLKGEKTENQKSTGKSTNPRTVSQSRYDSENTRAYRLKLNKKTDRVIIEKLSTVPSMQGYIKELILKDVRRNGIGPKKTPENKK